MKRYTLISIIAVFSIIILITCKKAPEIENSINSNKIDIGTTTMDSISYFSAIAKSSIIKIGDESIIQHGHCWSSDNEPNINNNKTNLGSLTIAQSFTSEIVELDNNTKYYIRPYITTKNGTIYGEERDFATLKTGKPLVGATEVYDIEVYSASAAATIIADSGLSITNSGFCWDTIQEFSLTSCIGAVQLDINLGDIQTEISNLNEGEKYYLKAFATNGKGTAYGEMIEFSTKPITPAEVNIESVFNITINSSFIGANVADDGNGVVSERGICWNTIQNPTIETNLGVTNNGIGMGSFVSQIHNLNDDTQYHVRAYAINEKGVSYSDDFSFTTLDLSVPEVITENVSNITVNSSVSGGNVIDDGNGIVTHRGICWNTFGNPTLENNIGFTDNGGGLGSFTSELNNLNDGTQYYVQAYATNEDGTSYGGVVSFTTLVLNIPTVTTFDISDITANSAKSGGNVTSDGNGTVTGRGICWNTTGSPSLQNNIGYTVDGIGLGMFNSNMTDLIENTYYYVRSYAVNEKGAAYGQEKVFVAQDPPCGQLIIEYGGQVYNTVLIGSQCWMKENLNIGTIISDNQNMTDNSVIEKYCPSVKDNCDTYGGLYQWDEMMQYTSEEGAQGICPDGWHIPSALEWTVLRNFQGGADVAGGAKKEIGYEHWNEPNTGATNSSGFTALPGGRRDDNGTAGLGNSAYFWSSTKVGTNNASRIILVASTPLEYNGETGRSLGASVRCIKD